MVRSLQKVLLPVSAAAYLTLSSVGCGPMYETRYSFTPPKSANGRTCIFQCDNSRMQCRNFEEMHKSNCEMRGQLEEQRCENDIRYREGREPKWYECSTSSCSADYDRCDEIYRGCYQMCGGEVRSETVCVANCDQIQPQQRK